MRRRRRWEKYQIITQIIVEELTDNILKMMTLCNGARKEKKKKSKKNRIESNFD